MPALQLLTGSLTGQTFELGAEPVLIGRGPRSNIVLGDAGVSTRHATVWTQQERWYVADLGSTNGTFLNGQELTAQKAFALHDGDQLAFGNVQAAFALALSAPGLEEASVEVRDDLSSAPALAADEPGPSPSATAILSSDVLKPRGSGAEDPQVATLKAEVARLEQAARETAEEQDRALWRLREELAAQDAEQRAQLAARTQAAEERQRSLEAELQELKSKPSGSGAEGSSLEPLRAFFSEVLENVNGDVSVLRRNAEILKGYIDDVQKVAELVTGLDTSGLDPAAQARYREAVEEIAPDTIAQNMQAIGVENADTIARAKALVQEMKEALAKS